MEVAMDTSEGPLGERLDGSGGSSSQEVVRGPEQTSSLNQQDEDDREEESGHTQPLRAWGDR